MVNWLWNMLAMQKCWQIHLPGGSDKHNVFKTYAHVNDVSRELELQQIAPAHHYIENRLLSIQPKLCKIALSPGSLSVGDN